MRIYLSGPITGNEHFEEAFRASETFIKGKYPDAEVVNPARTARELPTLEREEYLKIDLAMLDACDSIFMMPGWEKSCGANREYGYALAKGIRILKG